MINFNFEHKRIHALKYPIDSEILRIFIYIYIYIETEREREREREREV